MVKVVSRWKSLRLFCATEPSAYLTSHYSETNVLCVTTPSSAHSVQCAQRRGWAGHFAMDLAQLKMRAQVRWRNVHQVFGDDLIEPPPNAVRQRLEERVAQIRTRSEIPR